METIFGVIACVGLTAIMWKPLCRMLDAFATGHSYEMLREMDREEKELWKLGKMDQ